MSLLAGDNFVRKNLQSNLAYNVVYLIPSFHLDIGFSPEDLERWAKYLHSYLGKLTSLEGWRKFQQQLENFRDQEEHKASFLINFLFVQRSRAEVRIQKLVQDVPPFRLDLLVEKRNEIKERGDRLFEESDSWDLSLRRIFWLFPVRKHQQMVLNTDVLNFYEALFTGRAVKHGLLMANFLEMSRMHYYKNYRPYVHKPQEGGDTALVRFLLQSALLISYLKALKMLKEDNKGGEMMDEFLTELPEDIKNYIEQMDYGGSQAGLFLLGYLIGRIGTEQHKASPGSTKKPILNKINFMAMSLSRIQRLSNDIFEKLDQYRILPYNERIFAAMKGLLDKNRSSWGLSHQENVYYILSGYAYATWGAIREGLERKKSTKEGGDYNEQSNAKFGDLVPL
jgi:CRISPR-associated protein Csh1